MVFRWQMSISVLGALTASAPAVPFVGPAVLGDLFGEASAIAVAIGFLVINLTVVPITVLLLELDAMRGNSRATSLVGHGGEDSGGHSASRLAILGPKLAETAKLPIVWSPVLAFVIVLSGIRIPQLIVHSLSMLGQASGGVALFTSGIVLAAENHNQPASVVSRNPEKHPAACDGPRGFAVARLWQSLSARQC